jgi:divalent metal cation (Fe/Co/Zn/Cd) transporter
MHAFHRGRLDHYEFGVGKLERFIWVVVGFGMLLAAYWVAQAIFGALVSDEPPPSPLGLAIAAVVNAINVVINGLGLYVMLAASRDSRSGVFGVQVRARVVMLVVTAILQVTLTVAALVKDPAIALALDALGGALVVYVKITRGIDMIVQGLPALLDAPAAERVAGAIRRAVAAVIPPEHTLAVRSRRSGDMVFAEAAVAEAAFPTVRSLRDAAAEIRRELNRQDTEIDLSVVVRPGPQGGADPPDPAPGKDVSGHGKPE